MLSEFSYPIVCSQKFSETVAFYEDYFDFEPAFEMEGFVVLKRRGSRDMYLAIMDANNKTLPEQYRRPVQGMILNYPVGDADAAYRKSYLDGLNVVSESPEEALCGRRHYFVEDPNGILIDVAQEIDLADIMTVENADRYVLVS